MTSQSKKDKNNQYGSTSFSYDTGFYSKTTRNGREQNQDYVEQGLMPLSGSQSMTYNSARANGYGGQETLVSSSALDTTRRRNVDARSTAPTGMSYAVDIYLEREQQKHAHIDSLYKHNISSTDNIQLSKNDELTPTSKRQRRTQRLKSIHTQNTKMKKKSFSFLQLNKQVDIILYAAVLLWYLLGVLSISTTKLLLRDYGSNGITPLFLTMQQFLIGFFFLRLWIYASGKEPQVCSFKYLLTFSKRKSFEHFGYDKLVLSATFFTIGFWLTNLSFSSADASFVETIKASEPITSAALAVLWGIEQLSFKEVTSLIGLCLGVVISTLGNAHGKIGAVDLHSSVSLTESFYQSGIVMIGNLCFSFRGLYQKLFRASPDGSKNVVDDLNLQYRFHQIGILVLIVPLGLYEMPSAVRYWLGYASDSDLVGSSCWTYCGLSIVNAFAFTHYK